jgi:RecA-family ATPase
MRSAESESDMQEIKAAVHTAHPDEIIAADNRAREGEGAEMIELAPHIATIARRLLGAPNPKFPSRDQWRYGNNGSLAIEVTGEKQGEWFDHEKKVGGGPFTLIKTYAQVDDEGARKWIADELGLKDDPPPKGSNICYNYVSEDETLLFQVVRVPATAKHEKFFFQRQPDDQGGWKRELKDGKLKLTMEGARLVPYHLDRLVAAKGKANGHPPRVFICEGEKDADRVAEAGFLTTTSPGGAGKWRSEYNQYFAGFEVVILPDNDKAGRDHAQHVAAELAPVAHSARIVSFEGLREKGDVSDWIDRGGTAEQLEALVAEAKVAAKPAAAWTLTRPSDWVDRIVEPRIFVMEDWLPLAEYVSLYGVAGARKTDFIIQALMAASLGLPFCGYPMGHYVTIGLFCEDTEEELIRRIDRIAAFYGRSPADFTGFFWASLVGCDQTEFISFDFGRMMPQDAFRLFEQQIAELGAGLAALDTIADFFGGEEISRRQVSQFLRMLNGCCFRNKCTIIGSRHPSQRGRSSGTFESGSTGWEGKERARLHLRDPGQDGDPDDAKARKEHTNKRVLTRAKCNYAMPGEEIELVFEEGGFKRIGADRPRGHIRELAADAKFLELLRSCNKLDRHVHDGVSHPGQYAPKVFASHPDRADFSQAEFKRAMDRLYAAGRIIMKRDRSGKHFEEN